MKVAIIDITRMQEDRICVAGVCKDESGAYQQVRPVPRWGNITKEFLDRPRAGRLEQFSMVDFDFKGCVRCGPHVEDRVFDYYDAANVAAAKKLTPRQSRRILEETSSASISEIFGEKLVDNKFIYEGEPGRSLGCMKPSKCTGPYAISTKRN